MSKLEEFLEQVKKNNPDQQKTVLLEMVEFLFNVSRNCTKFSLGEHALDAHVNAVEKIAEKYK